MLDQAPEVIESTTPYYGPTKLRGDIAFENVVLSQYSRSSCAQGHQSADPGREKGGPGWPIGGGNTTLVKPISTLRRDPTGFRSLHGVDNRLYPLEILRDNVSMVLQDALF